MERRFGYGISDPELQQLKALLRHTTLLILAGPNGVGKGTILNLLINDESLRVERIRLYTTKSVGTDETHDQDYFYVSQETYEEMRNNRQFLQWQQFPYGCYAISIRVLFETLKRCSCAVIDTGVGASLDLKMFFQQHAIPYLDAFITPVALDTLVSPEGVDAALVILRNRMSRRKRGEADDDLKDRLDTAQRWLGQVSQLPFRSFVPNVEGHLDEAYHQISAMIRSRLDSSR